MNKMNKMKILILLFELLFASSLFAQEICNNGIDDDNDGLIDFNDVLDCSCDGFSSTQTVPSLIPNFSFENNTCCPSSHSQLGCANGWIQASNPTSDYWNTCGANPFTTAPSFPLPGGGNGYVGIWDTPNGGGPGGLWQEHIGACLSSPMLAGNSYELSIWVAASGINGVTTIPLTIYGTTNCGDLPFNGWGCPVGIGNWSQLGTSLVNCPTNQGWVNVTFTFIPTVDINAIDFGGSCAGPVNGYFYLDELLLAETSAFSSIVFTETGGFCTLDKTVSAQIDTSGGVWQWYKDDIAIVGQNNATLDLSGNNLTPGNYAVTYTVGNKCEKSDITISPPNYPTADFYSDSVCETFTTNFTDASLHNAVSITNWEWDFTSDAVIDDNTQNPTNIFSSDGAFPTKLTVTNDEGCKHDTTKLVIVDPVPNVDFNWTDVCDGEQMTFTDQSSINTGTIKTWAWVFGDGTGISSAQDTVYDYTTSGSYNVQLTVVSDSGCTQNRTQQVNVWNTPTASFTFLDTCDQSAVNFASNSNGNGGVLDIYEWDFTTDGSIDDNTANPSFTYSSPNTYTVTLAVTTSDGCSDDTIQDVTIYPNPVISISGQNVCEGNTVNFTNNSSITSGSITNYFWDFQNGNTSTQTTPSETYNNEGVYQVGLNVISDHNCIASGTTPVEIYPIPTPQFITSNVCDGSLVNFTDFSSVSNSNTTNSIVTWNWNFGDTPAGIATGSNTNYLYNSDGTYTVTLDILTNNGCTNTTQQDVTVYPNPSVSFTSPNPEGCTELCTNFNNTSTITSGTIASYLWSFGDGNASTDTSPFNCISNNSLTDETYTVTLTATSNNGCQTTLVEPNFVTVYPLPIADFEPSTYVTNIYQTQIEFENTSFIGNTYLWDFDQLESSTDEHTSYLFPDGDSATYLVCLQTTSIHSCIADTCKLITVLGSTNIYIPNTFTPDGDGINDLFTPSLFGVSDKDFEFTIFNRWGELIYISTNPNNTTWDGTHKGIPAQLDTYIWKCSGIDKYSNETISLIGHVNLIK